MKDKAKFKAFLTLLNWGTALQAGSSRVHFLMVSMKTDGLGSSVGIATGYGLDSPGIETLW